MLCFKINATYWKYHFMWKTIKSVTICLQLNHSSLLFYKAHSSALVFSVYVSIQYIK